MLVVNLFAGPGAGKSTLSAYTFAQLKMRKVNCELVTEFAKDKVWEQNACALNNQVYVFAKQSYRISRCADKVDVVITDSPMVLSALYNKDPVIDKPLRDLIKAVESKYESLNYFLKRKKVYNPVGRLQTETEAKEIDQAVKKLLADFALPYREIDGDLAAADVIVQDVLSKMEAKNGTAGN